MTTSVVVNNQSDVGCPVIEERIVEIDGCPTIGFKRHTAAEHQVGIIHRNPIIGVSKSRLVGTDQIDGKVTGFVASRCVVERHADDLARLSSHLRGSVDLLCQRILGVSVSRENIIGASGSAYDNTIDGFEIRHIPCTFSNCEGVGRQIRYH